MLVKKINELQLVKLFLFLTFLMSPFVDGLNGYFVLNGLSLEGGSGSIGQIYRFLIFLLALLIICKTKHFLYILFIFTYFFFLESFSFFLHGEFSGFLVGIIYANKILYIIAVFFALTKAVKFVGLDCVIKLFVFSAFICAFILGVTTFFGVNSTTYATGGGTKGVFASGNGLSVFLGAASLIAYNSYMNKGGGVYFVLFFIVLFACISVGTKASIIFLLVSSIFVFANADYRVKLLIFSSGCYLFLSAVNLRDLFIFFDVIGARYDNSPSFFSFLASSRDVFFEEAYSQYVVDGFFALRVLFGLGVFVSYRDPTISIGAYDTLESDFLDVFYMYGVFGVLAYLGLFIFIFLSFIKKKRMYLAVVSLCTFSYSLVAGHVLFNAMSSMIVSILMLLAISSVQTREYEN